MSARPIACLGLLLLAGLLPADEAGLKEARRRWLRGNYAEAQKRFEGLLQHDKLGRLAVVGLSRCLESQGEYDRALSVIDAALKDHPKDARLLARQAELLHLRGRWEDARKAAQDALAVDGESFLAHWILGQVHREQGDLKKADAEFRWLVRTYTQRSNDDKDVSDPEELLWIGLAGAENARWNRLPDQFDDILLDVWGDAIKNDPDFWPAKYQSGLLRLEKFDQPEALANFDQVLKINPYSPEGLLGKGQAALQAMEYQDAERLVERALKINPRLPEALRLRADIHLAVGHIDRALKDLDAARQVNPRDEQTLGRIAACFALQKKAASVEELLTEVKKHNPIPGLFHLVLANVLDDRRHYSDAEKHYKRARELRPVLSQATGQLGLLYMRMGKEKEAEPLLDDAFKADPFHIRISNTRKVLRHLRDYKTIRTEHFELRYDPKKDSVLGPYAAEYLEQVYAELAKKFRHEPKGPILVEIFSDHNMFSSRVIALPDLHTIGACTGRMIAMDSPRAVRKPFNWARVLRHELVHIFNLDQSDFLCPHWFTEGLAVISEGLDRPQSWNNMLRMRVPTGDVLNLDTIDLAFMRPRSDREWQLAYCQAQLYVEYLEKAHGQAAIGEMLNAYREGLGTVAALQKVCKVDRDSFEKGYRKHLDEVVKQLGGPLADGASKLAELRDAHKEKPDDLDIAARLAEALLKLDRAEARRLARLTLEKKPDHGLAIVVLARLDRMAGDADRARELLEKAYEKNGSDVRLLRELGQLYFEAGEVKKARPLLEKGHELEPYDRGWMVDLILAYAQLDNQEGQTRILKKYLRGDGDDLAGRKKLARLLAEQKKPAEVERYAREALEIDVTDAQSQEMLLQALQDQKKNEEAERVRKLLGK